MVRCDHCGNDYQGGFELKQGGRAYTFDCFECAISELAPLCETCGGRIIGHGVQADERVFCCAHCARMKGVLGLETHVETHGAAPHLSR